MSGFGNPRLWPPRAGVCFPHGCVPSDTNRVMTHSTCSTNTCPQVQGQGIREGMCSRHQVGKLRLATQQSDIGGGVQDPRGRSWAPRRGQARLGAKDPSTTPPPPASPAPRPLPSSLRVCFPRVHLSAGSTHRPCPSVAAGSRGPPEGCLEGSPGCLLGRGGRGGPGAPSLQEARGALVAPSGLRWEKRSPVRAGPGQTPQMANRSAVAARPASLEDCPGM